MQVPSRQTSELTNNRPRQWLPSPWRRGVLVLLLFSVATFSIAIFSIRIVRATMRADANAADDSPVDTGLKDAVAPAPVKFPVQINKPDGPPTVDTGGLDAHGAVVTVSCSTCHTIRQPNHLNKTVKSLDEFHSGMAFSHGTVSCLSCHNSNDYDALKLADGTRVEFTDVMTLCAQCHGPQMRDYQHGVHGGMNGYWDLTRGPQVKNNCVDCHNPHAPQFPKMQPTFKPKDRFLEPPGAEH